MDGFPGICWVVLFPIAARIGRLRKRSKHVSFAEPDDDPACPRTPSIRRQRKRSDLLFERAVDRACY